MLKVKDTNPSGSKHICALVPFIPAGGVKSSKAQQIEDVKKLMMVTSNVGMMLYANGTPIGSKTPLIKTHEIDFTKETDQLVVPVKLPPKGMVDLKGKYNADVEIKEATRLGSFLDEIHPPVIPVASSQFNNISRKSPLEKAEPAVVILPPNADEIIAIAQEIRATQERQAEARKIAEQEILKRRNSHEYLKKQNAEILEYVAQSRHEEPERKRKVKSKKKLKNPTWYQKLLVKMTPEKKEADVLRKLQRDGVDISDMVSARLPRLIKNDGDYFKIYQASPQLPGKYFRKVVKEPWSDEPNPTLSEVMWRRPTGKSAHPAQIAEEMEEEN